MSWASPASTAGRSRSAARTSPSAAASSWSGDRKKGGQGGFVEDLARELPHSAGQPDRRRRRQRHLDQQARPCRVPRRARLRALGRAAGQSARRVRRARHRGGRSGGARDPFALVGDGRRHQPGVRRRSARGRALARPEDHQGGARRRRTSRSTSPAPSTIAVDSEDGLLRADPALPLLHAAQRLGAAAGGRLQRSGRPLRRRSARASCRATAASPTTCAS